MIETNGRDNTEDGVDHNRSIMSASNTDLNHSDIHLHLSEMIERHEEDLFRELESDMRVQSQTREQSLCGFYNLFFRYHSAIHTYSFSKGADMRACV